MTTHQDREGGESWCTPGSFILDPTDNPEIFHIRSSGGRVVAGPIYGESNAYLIAAAPELREALQMVVDFGGGEDIQWSLIEEALAKAKPPGEKT